MLKSLFISSFVIIDQTTVDFDEGMTALTGETGAGKSIIINALEQLCGARASSSLVRKGSKKAVIEGVFDMNDSIQKILDELNIDGDDDLIITRMTHCYLNIINTTLNIRKYHRRSRSLNKRI